MSLDFLQDDSLAKVRNKLSYQRQKYNYFSIFRGTYLHFPKWKHLSRVFDHRANLLHINLHSYWFSSPFHFFYHFAIARYIYPHFSNKTSHLHASYCSSSRRYIYRHRANDSCLLHLYCHSSTPPHTSPRWPAKKPPFHESNFQTTPRYKTPHFLY